MKFFLFLFLMVVLVLAPFLSPAPVLAEDEQLCTFTLTLNGVPVDPLDYPDFVNKHIAEFLSTPEELDVLPMTVSDSWVEPPHYFLLTLTIANDSEHPHPCEVPTTEQIQGFHNGFYWINVFVSTNSVEVWEDYNQAAVFKQPGSTGDWTLTHVFQTVYLLTGPNTELQIHW